MIMKYQMWRPSRLAQLEFVTMEDDMMMWVVGDPVTVVTVGRLPPPGAATLSTDTASSVSLNSWPEELKLLRRDNWHRCDPVTQINTNHDPYKGSSRSWSAKLNVNLQLLHQFN